MDALSGEASYLRCFCCPPVPELKSRIQILPSNPRISEDTVYTVILLPHSSSPRYTILCFLSRTALQVTTPSVMYISSGTRNSHFEFSPLATVPLQIFGRFQPETLIPRGWIGVGLVRSSLGIAAFSESLRGGQILFQISK